MRIFSSFNYIDFGTFEILEQYTPVNLMEKIDRKNCSV